MPKHLPAILTSVIAAAERSADTLAAATSNHQRLTIDAVCTYFAHRVLGARYVSFLEHDVAAWSLAKVEDADNNEIEVGERFREHFDDAFFAALSWLPTHDWFRIDLTTRALYDEGGLATPGPDGTFVHARARDIRSGLDHAAYAAAAGELVSGQVLLDDRLAATLRTLTTRCPKCQVPAGSWCKDGGDTTNHLHLDREDHANAIGAHLLTHLEVFDV